MRIYRGGKKMAEKEGLLPFKLIEDETGEALPPRVPELIVT